MHRLQRIEEASSTTTVENISQNNLLLKVSKIFGYLILFTLYTTYTLYAAIWCDKIERDTAQLIIYLYGILIIYLCNRYSIYKKTLFKLTEWICDVFQETKYRNISMGLVSGCEIAIILYQCYHDMARLYSFLFATAIVAVSIIINVRNIQRIEWSVVLRSFNLQFLLATLLFYFPYGRQFMLEIGRGIVKYLKYSEIGATFVYGNMLMDQFILAFYILSAIYLSLMTIAILRYMGFIEFLKEVSVKVSFLLGITPTEGVFGLVNTCLSMTETCVVIKNQLEDLSSSELFSLMVTGLSTISFTALFAYVSLGANIDYLIISVIISIPCSFAFSKIFMPFQPPPQVLSEGLPTTHQERRPLNNNDTRNRQIGENDNAENSSNDDKTKTNILDECLKSMMEANFIIQVIISNLIAMVSFTAFLDKLVEIILSPFIEDMGLFKLLTFLISYIMPATGVDERDSYIMSEMFVKKILINEFVSFEILGKASKQTISERSLVMANFILCGFGNISAAGMLSSIISSLTDYKINCSRLVFKSLFVACIVNIYCACTISILF